MKAIIADRVSDTHGFTSSGWSFARGLMLLLLATGCLIAAPVVSPGIAQEDDAQEQADSEVVAVRHDLTDLTELVGQTVDIATTKGKFYGNVLVVEVTHDEDDAEGSIKSIRYQIPDSTKKKKIGVRNIAEIYINAHPLDVKYENEAGRKYLIHDPEARAARLEAKAELKARLAGMRKTLWEPLPAEEMAEYMEIHRGFLEKVQSEMQDIQFQLVETGYYLFLTDLPASEVEGYIAHLDRMYEVLCSAFGIPPTRNIWCGKCVVVAFQNKADYLRFEMGIMNVPGGTVENSQGLCHSYPDGKVIFAGYRGDQGGFAHVLVHETSHGFVHRYLSSVRPPSWLNEGISDWLANEIVGGERIPRRRIASAKLILARRNWGTFMTDAPISGDMYGAASSLVALLRQKDEQHDEDLFKNYFDAIKTGMAPEEALKEHFGMSEQDLQAEYLQKASGG